jgi:Ca-activated chloride channel family protein
MTQFIQDFHFIYPMWLVLILPLIAILMVLFLLKNKKNTALQQWVEPQLAPFVLTGQQQKTSYHLLVLIGILSLVAIIAMAGPSWEKRKQASFKQQQALVIALDLSTSMYAKDVQPSRLVRARFELIDLLKQRKEGQTALIVYAGDAFVVSPLTDDAETIEAQAKLLNPAIMPVQGNRTAVVIKKAQQLLAQTQLKQGHILLITDEIVDQKETLQAINTARSANIQTSILGVGTLEGSPIPLSEGGFVKNNAGNIVLAKLNANVMQTVANAGAGIFVQSVIGDQDLNRLSQQFSNNNTQSLVKDEQTEISIWINEGIWLVFLFIPVVLLLFRKGYLASISLVFFMLPQSEPSLALSWDGLWSTPDQQGQQAFSAGDNKQAVNLFENPNWKASAAYQAGDYQAALQSFIKDQSAEGFYNTANSLVKLNKIPEAMAAYTQALKLNKNHVDAKYNLDLLKQQQKQQQSQQQKSSSDQQDSQQQKNQDGQDGNKSEQQNQQSSQDEQNEKNKKDAQASENSKPDNADQQDAQQKAAQEAEKQALEDWKKQQKDSEDDKGKASEMTESTEAQDKREQQQATEQWLRRIPDDPTVLWQRKFQYQYKQGNQYKNTGQTW